MKLKGKIAVITGASMGIGESIAQLFVREGAYVALSSRSTQGCEAVRARIGHSEQTIVIPCDVRDRGQIEQLVRAAIVRFGRIDIWVNNAGFGLNDGVTTMSMDDCRAMFDTNLFGAIDCMQAVAPVMRQGGGGTIVNISSVAGHIAVPYMAAYCATKHALNAIGKGARLELKGENIHVLTVCPGYIRTNFGQNMKRGDTPLRLSESIRRGIAPERVAHAVLRGYLGRKREVVVPVKDRVAIFLYQRFPRLVEAVMAGALRPGASQAGTKSAAHR